TLLLSCFAVHASATPETHPISLHDALPILWLKQTALVMACLGPGIREKNMNSGKRAVRNLMSHHGLGVEFNYTDVAQTLRFDARSEEHTSELQSRENLVCRLLLEKKKERYS